MKKLTSLEILKRLQTHIIPEKEAKFGAQAIAISRFGSFVGADVLQHSKLPRAMQLARELIHEAVEDGRSFNSGTIILADQLEQSKGRFTRHWHAPEGGLWGCLVHVGSLQEDSRKFIPLAVGLSCCEALRDFGIEDARIRWVNDVLVGGVKLAGFLIESFTDYRYGERYDLIGFGINVNNTEFPPELNGLATSMKQILGYQVDLHQFALSFFARLAWNMGLLYHFETLDHDEHQFWVNPLLDSWKALSDTEGQRVVFGFDVMESPQYEATVLKVLDDGSLLMQFDDGTTITENSGEIRYLK